MAGIGSTDTGGILGSRKRVRMGLVVVFGLAALVLVTIGIQTMQREPTCREVIMGPGDTCEVQVQPNGSWTTYSEARAEDQDASRRFLALGGVSAACAAGLMAANRGRRPTVARSGSE